MTSNDENAVKKEKAKGLNQGDELPSNDSWTAPGVFSKLMITPQIAGAVE
jgi:hypothetical protein